MSIRHPRGALAALMMGCTLLAPPEAWAQVDPPSGGDLYAFPGQLATPSSAGTAGFAMADRWLGDEPFSNPAAPGHWSWSLSPLYMREGRQDLSAANTQFSESTGSFDLAGASLSAPLPAATTLWLTFERPLSLSDDVAFYQGHVGDPLVSSALVTATSEVRESRLGASLGHSLGPVRAGLGLEWTQRKDSYQRTLESGAPESGTRTTGFDGSGVGFQSGFRWDRGDSGTGQVTVGAGLRYLPKLSLSGTHHEELLVGSVTSDVNAEREAGWEGGLSVAVRVTEAFRMIAGLGGRSAQDWTGLGVTSGAWANGALALDYHDPEAPWMLHAGFAVDQQSQVPEQHAGTLGLSFGWDVGGAVLELGGIHRSISHGDAPRAYQDRVVLSVRSVH